MEAFFSLGYELILFLQSIGSWFISVMRAVTFLGDEEFYLLILPAIYWCLNPGLGLRIGVILMLSGSLNTILKVAIHTPRPYWVDPSIITYTPESSFGIPSGHAQNAVAVWGVIAWYLKKPWIWMAVILLIFLIGLSRLVVGNHYPMDALTGWAVGALLLYIFANVFDNLQNKLASLEVPNRVSIILGVSLGIALMGALITLIVIGSWRMPQEWVTNAFAADPTNIIQPFAIDGLLTTTGTLFGLIAGVIYLNQRGGFDPAGTATQLVIRYLIGLVGLLLIWGVLGQIFPRDEHLLSYGLRYFRYALIGLWVSWLAPLIFIRLKLAKSGKPVN
jgi:membrane-associated phospholipid phosphatase